ncbi:bifunctional phosphopantothenoylcysteine decarboxylase/phosphopantothenate--cysteine ligase CoaBC [Paeniglutamicibacter sp.]|uniref:bifunctional phosphopantothenoylcysteine decarboxylase/phosphopantothenate--cysteine ligase CoaBC n=1 Tax=Paeniglutamicibacter sp. TaxID=1934391 RepID=UPI00398A509A
MKRIVLGVSAGIAAYKAALLLRLFKEAGHQVDVIPTAASLEFVGLATWEALSGRPVRTSVFEAVDTVNHVRLGQEADLVVIAPATADVMARAAAGMANDLLTGTLLATGAPVVMAPAMHTEMWEHPATVANVALLRSRGVHVIEPAVGRLTGKDSGAGRFPEPEDIFAALAPYLEDEPGVSVPGAPDAAVPAVGPLAGKVVAISAGGTREPLDPVRYLGNRSSGRQGIALAKAALAAGATVRFIAAHMDLPAPAGVQLSTASTARQLQGAVAEAARGADVLIMSAAVADFRPAEYVDSKIKKSDDHADPVITLVRNPDILATLVADRAADRAAGGSAGDLPGLIVGFAAETGDAEAGVLEYGAAKLKRKGCEMLVVNEVGENLTFGTDENSVTILFADGTEAVRASGSKDQVAASVIEAVTRALAPVRLH